jgi:hypothetical protein
MADASIGEVEITLDGKAAVLRCSLAAAKRINASGGFSHVANRLGQGDLDFYVAVVAAGLDKKASEVENAVYKTGMPSLVTPLSTFVDYLVNGGRPVAPSEGSESGEA